MDGNISIYAAPLQGYTEAAWRNAHHTVFGGTDGYFTPFVRIEKGAFRNKDLRDINPENNTAAIVPQLIASTGEEMERLVARIAEYDYTRMDVNMGCPFPLITAKGKGAGILPHPERVKELCDVIKRLPEISFSVKMRTGLESHDEWKALIETLNDTPLEMITLHPRTGRQQYKGEADREAFGAFLAVCRHKVVYNGDLLTPDDIDELTTRYPQTAGIMLGRGLLARPWLAAELRDGKTDDKALLYRKTLQMHDLIYDHLARTLEGGEQQLLSKIKPLWDYLLPDLGKKERKAILKSTKADKYREAVRKACCE